MIVGMGRFGKPFGVKGWIKVNSYTQPPSNILNYLPWQVKINGQWHPCAVEANRVQGTAIIAKIKGIETPEDVRPFVNLNIGIHRSQLPSPASGHYYWHDLEGLQVIDQHHQVLGSVDYLFHNGAHDVLVITGQQEYLIPYLPEQTITHVDLKQKIIYVDWETDF